MIVITCTSNIFVNKTYRYEFPTWETFIEKQRLKPRETETNFDPKHLVMFHINQHYHNVAIIENGEVIQDAFSH